MTVLKASTLPLDVRVLRKVLGGACHRLLRLDPHSVQAKCAIFLTSHA
jgi:hypothetical protein